MPTVQSDPVSLKPTVPVLKWAGGKGQLLPHLIPLFPPSFARYHEPFLGGGAVFFYLAPARDVPAYLSDMNPDLIIFYRVLRDRTEEFINAVRSLAEMYEQADEAGRKALYYSWRNADRSPDFSTWSPLQRAVRFYFLNKTAYNGLYRTNRRGHFNVPWGRYTRPALFIPDALRRAARVLQRYAQRLAVTPFEEALALAQAGDFVYLDPPYVPRSSTAKFTAYTKDGFGEEDQRRLAALCRTLDRRGVLFMLSNSDTPLVWSLYRTFHVRRVWARRNISARGASRGPVTELVIRNYV